MEDRLLKRSVFVFNEGDNGGEQLMLTTEYYHNGEQGEVYTRQELSLESYGNSASFYLGSGPITADLLRKLANELDEAKKEALRNI